MPIFEYQATNQAGEAVRGTLVSPTLSAAATSLAEQGLHVVNVTMTRETPSQSTVPTAATQEQVAGWGGPSGSVPLPDLQMFFRQLAAMLHAGVNLVQALHTLGNQTGNANLRAVLHEAQRAAESGRPISEVMARHPYTFTPLMVSLIRAGEQGGQLEETCRQASTYCEREIELRNLYRRVTIYPKAVLLVSVLVILLANWIIGMVAPGGRRLYSPLTEPAIAIPLIIVVVLVMLYLRVGLKNPQWKQAYDKFTLRVPVLGNTLLQLSMAKFGRAMGALYRGGIPIHEAIRLGADASGNERLRHQIYPAIGKVKEGVGIATALQETGAFPPMVIDMVRTGETTGNLDQMLDNVAGFYEEEAQTKSHQLGVAAGVAILLLVGIYVGYVYITNMVSLLGGRVSDGMAE
jgi:type II secretory pathway component PulF